MLLLDGREDSLSLDTVLVNAISGARKIGLHRLGHARLRIPIASSTEQSNIQTEVAVRIWGALVMRDWSRGLVLGYYNIHPSHFDTRMPLHIDDDDLCLKRLRVSGHDYVCERPRSEFTMLSYTIHALETAGLAREFIDMGYPLHQKRQEVKKERARIQHQLGKKYESFVVGVPSYFKVGSTSGLNTSGPLAAVPVHRWMLHQQLWTLYLKLHRSQYLSQDGDSSCQLLAHSVIDNQVQIQARCAVCGSLATNETQVFSAAAILFLGLFFAPKNKDPDIVSAELRRSTTKEKIWEAIDTLSKSNTSDRSWSALQRGNAALEALMEFQESESSDERICDDTISICDQKKERWARYQDLSGKSLKTKIKQILDGLQRRYQLTATASMQGSGTLNSAGDLPTTLPRLPIGTQDLDVLPMVSGDESYDFWQFLDFAPLSQSGLENEILSNTAHSQGAGHSMTRNSSPGVALQSA
ncbi:MAG: hypothetical protein Q9222_005845 [Ikaeria aurantiellina]